MEVYFGIANFKPTYRMYNNGINEKYIENKTQGYTIEETMPINEHGSIKIDKYIWNPHYLSTAYTFGETNSTLNSSMKFFGERTGINLDDTIGQEFKYFYPLPSIPTSENQTVEHEYLSN